MKLHYLLVLAPLLFTAPACERERSGPEKLGDDIGDALDPRSPGEKMRDGAEDAGEDVKETLD